MTDAVFFLATLAVAAVGGLIFLKLKVPAGGMVGAMVAVIAFNLITQRAFFYDDLKILLQIFAGAMIGGKISKGDVLAMKKLIVPTIILLFCMVLLNLVFGSAMWLLSDINLPTALFASAPGGMTDMAIIADDLGANAAYVAILQLLRILIIIICLPPLFKRAINGKAKKITDGSPVTVSATPAPQAPAMPKKERIFEILALFLCATVGGVAFFLLGVTAGALIGGMLASAVFGVLRHTVTLPLKMRTGMQIFAGAFIGMRMDRESLFAMKDLIVPALVMLVGTIVFVFAVSALIHRFTKLDKATAMLASSPGGVQEMSLLADDLGADTPSVAIMQTARLMCVIILFPTMLSFVLKIFG